MKAVRSLRWFLGWLQARHSKISAGKLASRCRIYPDAHTRMFTTKSNVSIGVEANYRVVAPYAYRRIFYSDELRCERIM